MSTKHTLGRIRWWLADYFSYFACRLRGQKWYSTACYGIPGNRAAELKQRLWEHIVMVTMDQYDNDQLRPAMEDDLNELGQIAGENWGHRPLTPWPPTKD